MLFAHVFSDLRIQMAPPSARIEAGGGRRCSYHKSDYRAFTQLRQENMTKSQALESLSKKEFQMGLGRRIKPSKVFGGLTGLCWIGCIAPLIPSPGSWALRGRFSGVANPASLELCLSQQQFDRRALTCVWSREMASTSPVGRAVASFVSQASGKRSPRWIQSRIQRRKVMRRAGCMAGTLNRLIASRSAGFSIVQHPLVLSFWRGFM